MEINIMEYDVKDYTENNGYNLTDFDDGDDKCKKVYVAVNVETREESCYVGCLMESGRFWVVGCRCDGIVKDYDTMVHELKLGLLF